ncbi:MAG: hypothetical protein GX892_13025 [Thermoanaerobacteraceae bacterium]|nr:hypothetical protein [Thermoanaerobacteraceae bacterium]
MKKVYNGTPHSINIIEGAIFDPSIRKYVARGEVTMVTSIPSNGVLSAKIDTVNLPDIDGIPVYGKAIVGCDPLPEGYDLYIVSALYASAVRAQGGDTSKLYTVADPVYTEDGRTILGCRGICPAF